MISATALKKLTKQELIYLVLALQAALEKNAAELAEQEAINAKQAAKVEELSAALAQQQRNSSNSSNPPSSDRPGSGKPKPSAKHKKKRKKKRGGQAGHKRNTRPLVKPDVTHTCRPTACSCCGEALTAEACKVTRTQQAEVPPVKATVTEYVQETVACGNCGSLEQGELPEVAKLGFIGPVLMSVIALLSGRYRLSKREIKQIIFDLYGVDISTGGICKTEQRVSRAVSDAVDEAAQAMKSEAVVHMDETGWREDKKKAWLWVAATEQMAIFLIRQSRGSQVAKELVGEQFAGVSVSDRWSGYSWIPISQRQTCWAHLKRDWQLWVDLGGSGSKYGKKLLELHEDVFDSYHRYRQGKLSQRAWLRRSNIFSMTCRTLLLGAKRRGCKKVQGMAQRMLALEESFWTFRTDDAVPPTNNHAERTIRPAVLLRKGSFGTDSAKGSAYISKMLTAAQTLKMQGRSLLGFITESIKSLVSGLDRPSLLPPPVLAK